MYSHINFGEYSGIIFYGFINLISILVAYKFCQGQVKVDIEDDNLFKISWVRKMLFISNKEITFSLNDLVGWKLQQNPNLFLEVFILYLNDRKLKYVVNSDSDKKGFPEFRNYFKNIVKVHNQNTDNRIVDKEIEFYRSKWAKILLVFFICCFPASLIIIGLNADNLRVTSIIGLSIGLMGAFGYIIKYFIVNSNDDSVSKKSKHNFS